MEVGISQRRLERVYITWWDKPWGAAHDGDAPFFPMDQVMVESAQQDAVVGAGGTSVGVIFNVVGFAPRSRGGASGEGAAAVSGDNRLSKMRREKARCLPDVQNTALSIQDNRNNVGFTRDPADLVRRNRTGKGQHAAFCLSCNPVLELFVRYDSQNLWLRSATRRQLVGGQGDHAGSNQPIQALLRISPGITGNCTFGAFHILTGPVCRLRVTQTGIGRWGQRRHEGFELIVRSEDI